MPELSEAELVALYKQQAQARAAHDAQIKALHSGDPDYARQIRADYQPLIDFKEEVKARGAHRHR